MSDSREFVNKFPDYSETEESHKVFDWTTNKLKPETEAVILENVLSLLQQLEEQLTSEVETSDFTVYTGTSGYALLYLQLASVKACEGKQDYLNTALSYIEPLRNTVKKKYFSFLCGAPGALAVGSAVYNRSDMEVDSKEFAQRLENLDRDVTAVNPDIPDELLYGRAGYLYSLLFLRKYNGEDEMQDRLIKRVVAAILRSGKHWAKKFRNNMNFPLYYEWHDKAYIGSAHGFAGILYMLLQAKDFMTPEDLSTLVKPSIDLIVSLQFPSGNFPSSIGNNTDRLVHWCHGAPGLIHLLLLAYEVFSEEKYMECAKLASDVIWQRGLLKKGYGLCHGTAGNGYAHLRMFQVTKKELYLHRAIKFAEWCFDYGKHGCRTPDRPLSLFEGMAGTIYFLSDLLDPLKSAFPAFQLI